MEISTKVCGARAGLLLCAADEPEERGSHEACMGSQEVPETFDIATMIITLSAIPEERMAHVLLECLAVLQSWRHVALVIMAYSTWQCFGLCLGEIFLTGFMRARMELFPIFFA